jgi:N-acetylneuraminic acid mutarotase
VLNSRYLYFLDIMKLAILTVLITLSFSLFAQITSNSQWTWMKGSDAVDEIGRCGVQGFSITTNTPGAREGCVSWTDQAGNLWLFGGWGYWTNDEYGQNNDLWKYNSSSNNWVWMKGDSTFNQPGVYGIKGIPDDNNRPGARSACMSWKDASGNFWLFGGAGDDINDNPGNLNDLWKYDVGTNQWTWIKGNNIVGQFAWYGTKGVPDDNNDPGPRQYSMTWTDINGNFWMFGGVNDFGRLNDLWKYNPTTNQWTWINGSNSTNQYGSYGILGVVSPINQPGSREASNTFIDGSGKLWLLGGWGYTESGYPGDLNDLWKYDPTINQWTWIKGDKIPDQLPDYGTQGIAASTNKPGARDGSIFWKDNIGNFWILGGWGFDVVGDFDKLNDLWKYDPSSNQWTWIKGDNISAQYGIYGAQGIPDPDNKPGARYHGSSWVDGNGSLWLFGGYGYDGVGSFRNWLNDLWILPDNSVIPITINSVHAYQNLAGINVEWTLSQEIDMDKYEIEKSTTGVNFNRGGTVISSGNHSNTFTYSWLDVNPVEGANFYRIKMIGKDGKASYSKVVKVGIGKVRSINIYPNPATDNSITLNFNDQPKGNYNLLLLNVAGQIVYKNCITHLGGSGSQTMNLGHKLSNGVYNLKIISVDQSIIVLKVIISSK